MKFLIALAFCAGCFLSIPAAFAQDSGTTLILPEAPPAAPPQQSVFDQVLSSPILPGMVGGTSMPGVDSPANPTQAPSPSAPGIIFKQDF